MNMRNAPRILASLVFLLGIAGAGIGMTSCEEEKVEPRRGNGSSNLGSLSSEEATAFLMPDLICSEVRNFPLIDQEQRIQLSYCGEKPCDGNQGPWGDLQLLNSETDLYLNVTLADGWVMDGAAIYAGLESDLMMEDTLPQPDSLWLEFPFRTAETRTQILLPLDSFPRCFEMAVRVSTIKKLPQGGLDAKSRHFLWAHNAQWNDTTSAEQSISPGLLRLCAGICPPEVVTATAGDCVGCEASQTLEFVGCDTVRVSSCKELVGVRLVFGDCSEQDFEPLEGASGTFFGTGAHSGQEISHVYVKSGCYKSPRGLDLGRRFDAPCHQEKCLAALEKEDWEVEAGE